MTPEEWMAYYGSGGGQGGPAPVPPVALKGAPPPPTSGPMLGSPGKVDPRVSSYFGGDMPPATDFFQPSAAAPYVPASGSTDAALRQLAGAGGPKVPAGPPAPPPPDMSPQSFAQAPVVAPPTPKPSPSLPPAGPSRADAGLPPKPKASSSGAVASGPGDFGAGTARAGLHATFPREQQAIQDLATAERAKADALAAGMSVVGEDRVREAEKRRLEAEEADKIFAGYQEETQRQLDDVRSRKIDPNRLIKNMGAGWAILGGVLAGFYQGVTKSDKNTFLDELNRNMDRDIAQQERDLDRQTKSAENRRSLLSDMRATYKDKELARIQAKNLYYEGIKEMLAAEAATYDSPAVQARADAAINLVGRQQAALKLDEAAKRAAAAAAAAAFQRAEARHREEMALKWYEAESHRITAEHSGQKGFKEGQSPRERFVAVSMDPKTGEPVGYLARNATEAAKATEQVAATKQLIALANRAKEIRESQGVLGRSINRNNPDDLIQIYTPEWQTELRSVEGQLLGAIKQAEQLGALDNGVERFAKPIAGKLDSMGSSADVKLNELVRNAQVKLEIHNQALAGQRVRMQDGEVITFEKGANAPGNDRGSTGVRREAP